MLNRSNFQISLIIYVNLIINLDDYAIQVNKVNVV